jgi:hypothetical protein
MNSTDAVTIDGKHVSSGSAVAHGDPLARAASSTGRLRIIQAAERARQAMAHKATGCEVVSVVT